MPHIGIQKNTLITAFLTLAFLTLLRVGGAYAQSAPASLPNPYRPPIEKWGILPEGQSWGAIGGASFDNKGNLWVFERCSANSCAGSSEAPIVELDPAGKVLKRFGAGMFVLPHAIFVDKDNNIWVADADAKDGKGNQVVKFSPDGKVLMTLGKAGVSADTPDAFNNPTGVVVAPNGNIFITDGHGAKTNARMMKFSKDGELLKIWGKKGSAQGEFDEPHSIAMDSKGRVFEADRGNLRIQIFDQDGKFLEEWKQFGVPSGLFIDKNDVLYVAENRYSPDWKRGIRIGSAKTGQVNAFIPDTDQTPEGRAIGAENVAAELNGTIYAGEVDRKMLKKYVKQ